MSLLPERSWRTLLPQLLRFGTDLLFPPTCIGCNRIGSIFCDQCAQQVAPLQSPICDRCGRVQPRPVAVCSLCREEQTPLVWVRATTRYAEPLRSAVHAFKYQGRQDLAAPLARYLVAVFAQPPWPAVAPRLEACLPVPLHPDRLAARGYNQSALLAGALAAQTGLRHQPRWLQRIRATESQARLSARERRHNVADAFAATADVAGKHLLLVDDVLTTGSTLRACAAALGRAGAAAVYGLVLSTPTTNDPDAPPLSDAELRPMQNDRSQ